MAIRSTNRLSKIFKPVIILPKDAVETFKSETTSKSQRLMMELGLIRQANPGSFTLFPLALRSLGKLTNIVETEMQSIGGQKVELPYLASSGLWKKSGRLHGQGSELFQLKDRHDRSYVLSPTYEESVAELLSSLSPLSPKDLPLLLYQTTMKFRDEIKPRFGLIRGRQFLMKDLYSFDIDREHALVSYELVSQAYRKIFDTIGINYIKAMASGGDMGGTLSHEYHFPADIGEDRLFKCLDCTRTVNSELADGEICTNCGSTNMTTQMALEVGHTFLLEQKYTDPFKVCYTNKQNKPSTLQMGCFGLGLTRIIASAIEVLSKPNEIRWPLSLVPYLIVIIIPKAGSKEELPTKNMVQNLFNDLDSLPELNDDILLDDRTTMTIGKRIIDARRMGYPFIVVIGQAAMENPPRFELIDVCSEKTSLLSRDQLLNFFKQTSQCQVQCRM